MNPLDRARGFFQEKLVAPFKNKKTPYDAEQRKTTVFVQGIQELRKEAAGSMKEIKKFQASWLKGNQPTVINKKLQEHEGSLARTSTKINKLEIENLPKGEQKDIAKAKKEISQFISGTVNSMQNELTGLLAKKTFYKKDQDALKSLIGRFQEFKSSPLNDRNHLQSTNIQPQLFKIQSELGKAILKAQGYDESPGMIQLFFQKVQYDHDSSGFDFQGARLALDYILYNAKFDPEQRDKAYELHKLLDQSETRRSSSKG